MEGVPLLIILLFLLAFLSEGVIIFYLIQLYKKYDGIKRRHKELYDLIYQEKNASGKREKKREENEAELGKIKEIINNYYKESDEKFGELSNRLNQLTKMFPVKSYPDPDSALQNQESNTDQGFKYYLNELGSDNSFDLSRASKDFGNGMIYEISLKSQSDQEGGFKILDSVMGKSRISINKENYINKVAEEISGSFSKDKKIVTDKPGIVKREGDKWIIKDKTKIHYE